MMLVFLEFLGLLNVYGLMFLRRGMEDSRGRSIGFVFIGLEDLSKFRN